MSRQKRQAQAMTISQGLALAAQRKAALLAQIEADLHDLRRAGVQAQITATELHELEAAGLFYDFTIGEVIEGVGAW